MASTIVDEHDVKLESCSTVLKRGNKHVWVVHPVFVQNTLALVQLSSLKACLLTASDANCATLNFENKMMQRLLDGYSLEKLVCAQTQ